MFVIKKSVPDFLDVDTKELKKLIELENAEYDNFQHWVMYQDMRLFVEITQWQTKRGNGWSLVKAFIGNTQLV